MNWLHFWARTVVWIICYWIVTALFWLSLDSVGQDTGKPINWVIARWLGAGHIVLLSIGYYWITRVMFPTIVRERWLYAFLQAAGLYVLLGLATYFLYTLVGEAFMNDNEQLEGYYKRFERTGPFYSMTSLSIFLPNWWHYSIMLTAVALKVSREVYHVQNRALQLELNLLRAQINPHFLFNTLNNIYSIVEEKDAYAADILLKFGDIMRYTLYEVNNEFINLQQEVGILSDYIALERIRHDDTAPAHIDFTVTGDPNGFAVPPLLLLTLVENAFKHGIHATIGASWVRIRLAVDQEKLRFEVSNSKPASQLIPSPKHKINVHRVGLANIQRRLALLYPVDHTLTIVNEADTYSVSLILNNHGRTNLLLGRRRRTVSPSVA